MLILPYEIINKILSFRNSNPISDLLRPLFKSYKEYNNMLSMVNFSKYMYLNEYHQFLYNKLNLKLQITYSSLCCMNCRLHIDKLYYIHNDISVICYTCIKNINFESFN
jgi:hypothetical protein